MIRPDPLVPCADGMAVPSGNRGEAIWPAIRPLAVSALAKDLLENALPLVRAVYRSGVALGVGDRPDVCYLSAPGGGLLPLHVVVRQDTLAHLLRRLDAVGSDWQAIRLELDGVRVFRLALGPAELQTPRARSAVDRLAAWLRTRPDACGLGEPVAQALSPHGRIRSTLAAVGAGAPGAAAALRSLIGRGAGSTPAGDDILVGALAHSWASGASQAPLVRAMLALVSEFDRLTTAAGATYLRAAVQGAFGGDLLAFARALPRLPADRVFHRALRVGSHGATSGIDSLLGFVAAHEAARGAVV